LNPRVKICCIQNEQEAADAIRFGASAIGLVGAMPSGQGPIPDKEIYRIAQTVPPPIATFLLTSEQTASGIIDHHHRTKTSTIQIVDELNGRAYHELRAALPGVKLVQVIHVTDEQSVEEATELAKHVDAILLDSGNQKLAVKELGGTGRRHDWRLSRRIVETCGKPVFLQVD
jgi:phosphoribosylanthranilate isomerase